ncbi:Coenzyme F420 hydrogenase/dehydrogenase, beta subunit C-terminal domain [Blautia wexlerae]|uniref:Coenzyme F420 hydrogenase/dehydrogenase, beta subunit C-terminal domain n=1 Tax=Blautia wexlerae TaxID=418240 RepID=UPI002ED11BB4
MCQVAAVNQFIKDKTNLVTADLICHGTPSPYLLKKCLQEYGHDINTLTDINFRIKSLYELNRDGKPIAAFHTMDNYLIAFLHSYDYTENCYSCKFATLDRVSDITLGDSWGTELSGEVKNGVSLILCQSEKGKELIESAGLNLLDVDINNAISHNEQLNKPSKCSKSRDQFFENYNRYNNFGKALVKTAPGIVAKEKVKSIVKYIVRGGGGKTQAFMITVKDGKM